MFIKRLFGVVVLGAVTSTSILATGCASEPQRPYSVTGQQGEDLRAYDRAGRYHAEWAGKPWLNPRYKDDKGRYRPEWIGQSGR